METKRNIICSFSNHAPIRFWGKFSQEAVEEAKAKLQLAPGDTISDYVDVLWDAHSDFGHHRIYYYTCKSGKRIYFASYNSGMSHGAAAPKTVRTFLKDAAAIKDYFDRIDRLDEWYQICGDVDPSLIVDSDLL